MVGLRQKGVARGGGLSKISKKGVEQKRGEGKQKFKKRGGRGKLDQGVGALKRKGELETPYEVSVTLK